jgi:hypothetical protein
MYRSSYYNVIRIGLSIPVKYIINYLETDQHHVKNGTNFIDDYLINFIYNYGTAIMISKSAEHSLSMKTIQQRNNQFCLILFI